MLVSTLVLTTCTLQEVVEHWTAIPNQEEVHDLALLAVGQGESGCRGLEEDLRLMGLGCGSLARTAGGAAADASAGGAEQPALLPPSAAAALQRMQDRAVLAFAEAGQDSDSMLVALRKLATAKWGGQLLKVGEPGGGGGGGGASSGRLRKRGMGVEGGCQPNRRACCQAGFVASAVKDKLKQNAAKQQPVLLCLQVSPLPLACRTR